MPNYAEAQKITTETYNIIAECFSPILLVKNSSREEVEMFDSFIDYLPHKALIADLGCGTGKHGRYCAKMGAKKHKGFTVYGLDISKKMIEEAEKYNSKYPKIEVLRIEDMCDFSSDEKYDAVIIAYSLIHLDKEHAVLMLNNLHKHLNKNAYVLITVYKGDRNQLEPEPLAPGHFTYYRDYFEDEFNQMLNDTGYKIIKSMQWKDRDSISGGCVNFGYNVLGVIVQNCLG